MPVDFRQRQIAAGRRYRSELSVTRESNAGFTALAMPRRRDGIRDGPVVRRSTPPFKRKRQRLLEKRFATVDVGRQQFTDRHVAVFRDVIQRL